MRCLRDEAEADGSSAASSDPPTLLPLNVHNHAYLRLLKWDHAADPFPEVNAVSSEARHTLYSMFLSLVLSLMILFGLPLLSQFFFLCL